MPFFFACFLVIPSTHQKLRVTKEKEKREGGSFDAIPKNRLPTQRQVAFRASAMSTPAASRDNAEGVVVQTRCFRKVTLKAPRCKSNGSVLHSSL